MCVCYLGGLVGSPAVLVAVEAGQKHILIGVHLAEAQGLVGVVTDHIVAVQQLFGLWVSILQENIREGGVIYWQINDRDKKKEEGWYKTKLL